MLPFNAPPPTPDAKLALEDLLTGLADLKTKLVSGEPLEPGFLKELNDQLDALGTALGIDLGQVPDLGQLSTLGSTPLSDDATLSAKLGASLAPLAEGLLQSQSDPAAKAAGEKLAALLGAMTTGVVDADQLAELGLTGEVELDADAEAALAKLLAPTTKPETPAVAAAVLAKPTLELNEPVLTGTTSDEAAPVGEAKLEITADKPAADQSGSDNADTKNSDSKGAEAKPSALPVNATDNKLDGQATGQPPQQAARVDAVAAPRVVQTGYQTSQQQLNLPQIAFELARQTTEGNTRFQIRLDPAELGRIDVQLDIDNTGQVNARLYVERAETLDLMQRDQRGLEKALHQAGLDGAKTNLEFSLKQNGGGDTGQQNRQSQGRFPFGDQLAGDIAEIPPTINLYRASLSASGVNIIA